MLPAEQALTGISTRRRQVQAVAGSTDESGHRLTVCLSHPKAGMIRSWISRSCVSTSTFVGVSDRLQGVAALHAPPSVVGMKYDWLVPCAVFRGCDARARLSRGPPVRVALFPLGRRNVQG